MKTEHTPGPWNMKYDEHGGYDCMTSGWHIFAGDKDTVDNRIVTLDCGDYGAYFGNPLATPQAEANTHLIAAAPELLEMLEKAVIGLEEYSDIRVSPVYILGTNELIKAASAIIAKAKGL